MTKGNRQSWSDAPAVFVVAPACPTCGNRQWRSIRSEDNGDGSKTLRVVCRRCSARFKIVTEPGLPDYGKPQKATP